MSDKDKKAFILQVNSVLLKAIEQWAVTVFRYINGKIEFLLNGALRAKRKKRVNKNTDKWR